MARHKSSKYKSHKNKHQKKRRRSAATAERCVLGGSERLHFCLKKPDEAKWKP